MSRATLCKVCCEDRAAGYSPSIFRHSRHTNIFSFADRTVYRDANARHIASLFHSNNPLTQTARLHDKQLLMFILKLRVYYLYGNEVFGQILRFVVQDSRCPAMVNV